ncbi:hypothetical protein GCM10007863_33890 [Dyella mobilis]|nr:hypothetical protein GCM10007863_33890 [Dyella mobilis]
MRGVVPAVQQSLAFRRVEQVDVADGAGRIGSGLFDKVQQASCVLGGVRFIVQLAVGIHVQFATGGADASLQGDRQVVYQAVVQRMRGGRSAVELAIVFETHDIDAWPEGMRGRRSAQLLDILAAKMLMLEVAQDFAAGAAGELGTVVFGRHAEAQRQHVGEHGGNVASFFATCGHGEIEGADAAIADTKQVCCDHRRQQRWPLAGHLFRCNQLFCQCGGECNGVAPVCTAEAWRASADALCIAEALRVFAPIVPIAFVTGGCPVRQVAFEQGADRGSRRRRNRLAALQGRIDRGDAARGERNAGAVHDDVVVALVPEETLRAELEQRVVEQALAKQVVDAAAFIGHRSLRGGKWVFLLRHIDDVERKRRRFGQILARTIRGIDES